MIKIIPSISVMNGKCVRILDRDFSKATVYDESPLDVAKRFEDHGIEELHLIDLEGSKKGEVVNYDTLSLLTGHTDLKINFGGGINTDGDMNKAFEFGAEKVTIGSLALTNKELFASWLISYGRNKLCLSADSYKGNVVHNGWQKVENVKLLDHIDYHYQRSVQFVKCADTDKDGKLEGPAIDLYEDILTNYPKIKLMASGGVGSVDDIKKLADIGVYGVIFGKAYYEGKISLKELDTFIAKKV
ncbi:1-(5-phosphoribosyl)-5-[(5-phosphoribosylamino)methylideneamino] imidazole-4-carboxamide isomerase [Limibacter armeniacum]|uniref:1-(5-phosphoribosyl)-5-[(5- phosphoribosylamino)methylideneamino]imidazole-4- carboxamide isomerase n=1 Tax=Limibacter armeniacum TaxID=466084 RepID=UPI002FE62C38